MSKHTPGPWDYSRTVGDYTAKDRLFVRSQAIERSNCDRDVIVSEIQDHRFCSADRRPTDPQEQLANARLIAAAPELLEALKRLECSLADLPRYLTDNGHRVLGDVAGERLEFARAAIAKAEGGA